MIGGEDLAQLYKAGNEQTKGFEINANDVAGAPSYASEDRAVSFNYEPGSTFKAFTVAGALQDGVVSPSTVFNIPSVLQVADRQIHDAELWQVHEHRRHRLVTHARRWLRGAAERRGAGREELALADEVLDPQALTIGANRAWEARRPGALCGAERAIALPRQAFAGDRRHWGGLSLTVGV